MKTILAISFSLSGSAALAHESLVPHTHPHGVSMLPDLGTFIVGGIFVIAIAFLAYAKFGQR
jgi:drug/metabolite transporter (DMT)-like permease